MKVSYQIRKRWKPTKQKSTLKNSKQNLGSSFCLFNTFSLEIKTQCVDVLCVKEESWCNISIYGMKLDFTRCDVENGRPLKSYGDFMMILHGMLMMPHYRLIMILILHVSHAYMMVIMRIGIRIKFI